MTTKSRYIYLNEDDQPQVGDEWYSEEDGGWQKEDDLGFLKFYIKKGTPVRRLIDLEDMAKELAEGILHDTDGEFHHLDGIEGISRVILPHIKAAMEVEP